MKVNQHFSARDPKRSGKYHSGNSLVPSDSGWALPSWAPPASPTPRTWPTWPSSPSASPGAAAPAAPASVPAAPPVAAPVAPVAPAAAVAARRSRPWAPRCWRALGEASAAANQHHTRWNQLLPASVASGHPGSLSVEQGCQGKSSHALVQVHGEADFGGEGVRPGVE